MHKTFPFFTNRPAPPPVSDDMMPRGPAEKNAVKLLQGGLLRSTKRLQSALGSTGAWTVNLTHQYHLDIPCTKWSCGTQLDLGQQVVGDIWSQIFRITWTFLRGVLPNSVPVLPISAWTCGSGLLPTRHSLIQHEQAS